MALQENSLDKRGPGMVENAISTLNAWIGDYLSQTDNELQQPMAFYRDNRPLAPEDIAAPPTGKVCVLVHGLGCNESTWRFPAPHEGGDYGELLAERCGYMPLYLRFNTGLRVSTNGKQLAELLERFCAHHDADVTELLLIGHSMGGLVIRSACHLGDETGQDWVGAGASRRLPGLAPPRSTLGENHQRGDRCAGPLQHDGHAGHPRCAEYPQRRGERSSPWKPGRPGLARL